MIRIQNHNHSCLIPSAVDSNGFGLEELGRKPGKISGAGIAAEGLRAPAGEVSLKLLDCLQIDEVRSAVSPLPEKLCRYCSDASIARYLHAQNWNVQKATKMLRESLKWLSEYKPEEIRWEDVASEAETGKVYRPTSVDKRGRPVLVMHPCRQNSSNVPGQIKNLVYSFENAMLYLPPDQEQMIWLVDFLNFKLSNISMKVTKELAHIIQNYYPGRLGVAVLYNPPWIFEQFYKMVKPFLEADTRERIKFVYATDSASMKIMEELFDMEQFESVLGAEGVECFDIHIYAQRMKEDDEKRRSLVTDTSRNADTGNPSEEEEKEKIGDKFSASTTAIDSQELSTNRALSATATSLKESDNVKS